MPISDMGYEQGIFFARESGRIDRADAESWFVVVVDAREVTEVAHAARTLFAEATWLPNLECVVVAAGDLATRQKASLIGQIGKPEQTFVFVTMEEARAFAVEQASRVGGA